MTKLLAIPLLLTAIMIPVNVYLAYELALERKKNRTLPECGSPLKYTFQLSLLPTSATILALLVSLRLFLSYLNLSN